MTVYSEAAVSGPFLYGGNKKLANGTVKTDNEHVRKHALTEYDALGAIGPIYNLSTIFEQRNVNYSYVQNIN